MQSIQNLLVEMKCFLQKHKKIDGSQLLLLKINRYLEQLTQQQLVPDFKQKASMEKKSSNDDDYEIILDSQQQVVTTQGGKFIISPRKFGNLLDMFILQYSFKQMAYHIIPFSQQQKNKEAQNDRKAILQLIISHSKQHIKQKQKTQSMTELHKLTSNVPKSLPPLILPNYSNDLIKYIHIYEAKQCIQYKNKYYLVDRYYCFVADDFVTQSIDVLFRKIKSRIFQQRIMKVQSPLSVNSKSMHEFLKSAIPFLVDQANQLPLKINEPTQIQWVQKQIEFSANPKTPSILSSFLLLVTYLTICQFKIIFLTTKQEKHKLSDIMLSVEGALRPLKYSYPVVFCTLTKQHCDFVQSPVPLTIGYWGSQKRRQKFIKQFDNYVHQHENSSVIEFDLTNYRILYEKGLTNHDAFALQRMGNYIKKYGRGKALWQKISNFLHESIQDLQLDSTKQRSDWMKHIGHKIKNSQMYQIYKN